MENLSSKRDFGQIPLSGFHDALRGNIDHIFDRILLTFIVTVLCYILRWVMEEWMTKKELLQETGITYGQLYRWKRKGLIPEAWFVRRSTFTGQETFFPREAMLERIRWIQGMKPDVPLDDLAQKIRAGDPWEDRLPVQALWATLEPPIELGGRLADSSQNVLVTRAEFLSYLGIQQILPKHFPQSIEDSLAEFLHHVPLDWLEYPQTVLLGFVSGPDAWFMVVQSMEAVWWGSRGPTIQMSLSGLWNQVKSSWARVQAIHQGYNRDR